MRRAGCGPNSPVSRPRGSGGWALTRTPTAASCSATCAGPRPAQQGRRPAGLLPPPGPVPQHGEKVRPRREARAAAARPEYRPTLVDPYRDHLRKRRAENPGIPVQQLLREIRELGYQGSSNLLVRYVNQGRADSDRPHLAPRKAAQLLLTRPENMTDAQRETATRIWSACPEMNALASLIRSFAAMLDPDPGNEDRLQRWITGARAAGLPHLHSFTRGLDLDIKAATTALTSRTITAAPKASTTRRK